MNIQVAVLCDAATNDNEKLNLLGAFDTIYAPQITIALPIPLPSQFGMAKSTLCFPAIDFVLGSIFLDLAFMVADNCELSFIQLAKDGSIEKFFRGCISFRIAFCFSLFT